ncbi:MAG: hypothetical protein KKB37_17365, partial [Alphaproteobacteria bacterium]|nr:hypothetical protein [Alphaproteobacteria bacterium]
MAAFSEIQHPILKGEIVFQNFCLKLIRRHWDDDYAQEHGRRGQSQHGVDITGSDHRNGYLNAAMQCKGSETHEPRELSVSELNQEVARAIGYAPKLGILIVAYAGKRDEKLQKRAAEINTTHVAAGLFKLVVWSWDDIVARSQPFPDVAEELLILNGVAIAPPYIHPQRPKLDQAANFAIMQSTLAELQTAFSEGTPKDNSEDPVAQAKIDVFRDQILAGDGKAVVAPLRAFIATLSKDTAPRIRFRANANLGAALTQCGLLTDAAIAFDDATKADPDSPDGHAYAARAATFRDRTDKAFNEATKALELDPHHKLAAAILIDTAPLTTTTSALEKRLSDSVANGDVGWALSRRFSLEGEHDDALRAASQIEANETNWIRGIAIAEAILSKFEKKLEVRIGAPQSAENVSLLEAAKSKLETGWATIKKRADQKNWVHVAANLCAAYRLVGEEEEADELAIEALAIDPELNALKERAALAYMRRGEFSKATELANEVATAGGEEEALLA